MKTSPLRCSSFKSVAAAAIFSLGLVGPAQAINVALSGTSQEGNQPIIDFLTSNFQNVSLTFGDYSNPANIPVGTDLFIVGRVLGSASYQSVDNSATFNSLTIPVVAFTSYVTRPDGNRWGWHSGGISTAQTTAGNETTVTPAGAAVLGPIGVYDWWSPEVGFSATGTGGVGGGDILATIGGEILAAHWDAGELSGSGVAFGGERLLFNLPETAGSGSPALMPGTLAGQRALVDLLAAHTPLVPVPEPTASALVLGGLGALMLRRRQEARTR